MNDKNEPKTRTIRRSRADEQKAGSAAFDTWLERKLHDMFDSVAKEPIPDDLLKVIAQLDQEPEKK